jgi:folate-dependent phosphoribosylglycinamide formyltransferase PurN
LRLYQLGGDRRLVNAALKAIDLVKSAQLLHSADPNLRGGVPGSDPVWGDYIHMALPNWAVKFFVDALLEKRSVLAAMHTETTPQAEIPADVPCELPQYGGSSVAEPPRVILYAKRGSCKASEFLLAWRSWGFRPGLVIVSESRTPPLGARVLRKMGIRFGRPASWHPQEAPASSASAAAAHALPDILTLCKQMDVPVTRVRNLQAPESLEAVKQFQPDLAIFAGGGILRNQIIDLPKLGTLNAHMGMLPAYRGMNVAEWAALARDAVGCSVHLIDPGIDTGDILCVRRLDTGDIHSVAELRSRVNQAQIDLLGQVVKYVLATGTLPPARRQRRDEGRQYYRMHEDLLSIVASVLTGRPVLDNASGANATNTG